MKMKVCLIVTMLLVLAGVGMSQTTQAPPINVYAAGLSYNSSGRPGVAGTGLYAHHIGRGIADGTYAFTVVDVLPTNYRPFTVTTNFGGGISQRIATIGNVNLYIPTSAGVSYNGTNTGWAWSTGGMASIRVGTKGWRIFPNVRVVRSNVSNGSGVQPIAGIMFGWGQ